MLKTIKDVRIFGAALALALIAFIAASYFDRGDHLDGDYMMIGVYFLNPLTNTLEREQRPVPRGTNEEMINSALDVLLNKGPAGKSLSKTVPDFIKLNDGTLIENRYRLQLEFASGGAAMTPEEELIFKSSLCWTMTELPMISNLHIYIDDREMLNADGTPVGFMNRDNLIIGRELSPFRSEVFRAILYFANDAQTGLLPEERVIYSATTSSPGQNIARSVVEQLIAGPSRPDHTATVPREARVREVSTEGDICYVNLSAEAFTKSVTANGDTWPTVYSIVNSLTELEGIKRVQFLIDSKKPETVNGGHDLSLPVERDESYIIAGGGL